MENANLVWKSGAETSKCTLGTAAALLADPASLLSSLVGETDRETQVSPPPPMFVLYGESIVKYTWS
jgi:hypothetical protein